MKARVSHATNPSSPNLEVDAASIIRHFDHECQNLGTVGFSCLPEAAARVARLFPAVRAELTLNLHHVDVSTPSDAVEPARVTQFMIEVGSQPQSGAEEVETRLRVQLPEGLKASIARPAGSSIFLYDCTVELLTAYQPSASQKPISFEDQLSTSDVCSTLSTMCLRVVERFCEQVTFDSYAATLGLLAKAIMQAVRFPSPGVVLQSTRITTHPALGKGLAPMQAQVKATPWNELESSRLPARPTQPRMENLPGHNTDYSKDRSVVQSGNGAATGLSTGGLTVLDMETPQPNKVVDSRGAGEDGALHMTHRKRLQENRVGEPMLDSDGLVTLTEENASPSRYDILRQDYRSQ